MKLPDDLPAILLRRNNENPRQLHRGRFLTVCFSICFGEREYIVEVKKGRITSVDLKAVANVEATFTFAASESAWETFAQPSPPPGFQDVMAMVECKHATLTGDVFPVVVNLFFVKGVFDAMRPEGGYDAS
jgi:hypothetical protein